MVFHGCNIRKRNKMGHKRLELLKHIFIVSFTLAQHMILRAWEQLHPNLVCVLKNTHTHNGLLHSMQDIS